MQSLRTPPVEEATQEQTHAEEERPYGTGEDL
jgi:hypothetical protein